MSDEEVLAKYHSMARLQLAEDQAAQLAERVFRLEEEDPRDLMSFTAAGGTGGTA